MHARVVIGNELLNHVQTGVFQVLVGTWDNFLDLLENVDSDILVSIGLKDVSGDLFAFKAVRMDEVAELASSAAVRSMKIATGDSAEIAWLDKHVLVHSQLLLLLLGQLHHLGLPLFIVVFEAFDGVVGQAYQHVG